MSNFVSGTQVLSQTTLVIVPTENKTFISLTQIMPEALDRFQFDNVILRCDHLPEVFVSKEAATTLCTALLHTIFNGNNGKLFLYIKCEDANDVIDLAPVKNYKISFHTNRQCSEQWQKKSRAATAV